MSLIWQVCGWNATSEEWEKFLSNVQNTKYMNKSIKLWSYQNPLMSFTLEYHQFMKELQHPVISRSIVSEKVDIELLIYIDSLSKSGSSYASNREGCLTTCYVTRSLIPTCIRLTSRPEFHSLITRGYTCQEFRQLLSFQYKACTCALNIKNSLKTNRMKNRVFSSVWNDIIIRYDVGYRMSTITLLSLANCNLVHHVVLQTKQRSSAMYENRCLYRQDVSNLFSETNVLVYQICQMKMTTFLNWCFSDNLSYMALLA